MSWAPKVVKAYEEFLPNLRLVHTAIPSLALGGEMVDVAEFELQDGSSVYGTAGLSDGGGWGAQEMVLHAKRPDPALVELVSRIGGSRRKFEHGGTLPIASPDDDQPILKAVGFFYAGRKIRIEDHAISLLQIVGLTNDELHMARQDSLYTVEAMWWKDGHSRMCDPARGTSPSVIDRPPVFPADLDGLTSIGHDLIALTIHCDHDQAESIRGHFDEATGKRVAKLLNLALPHPSQMACFIHAMMDFAVEELRPICMRLLQLSPTDHNAPQYYADALGMLAAIEEGNFDKYWDSGFDQLCAEAERRRVAAGISICYGLSDSPFCETAGPPT